MLTLTLLVALLGFASGQSTNVMPLKCSIYNIQGDDQFGPLPINAHVAGCVNPPCQLPQLEDAIITLVFKAPHVIYSMTTLARANLAGLNIDYPLGEHSITCNYLENSYCPVIKDEVLVYTLRFYILQIFPLGTSVTVDFRIVDHNQEPLTCIRMPVQITAPAGRSDNSTSIV